MQVPRPVVSSPQSLGQSISVGKKWEQKQLPCYKIEELVLDDKSPLHPAKISHHLASSACPAQSSCLCKWVQSSIPEHKMWQLQHRQIYRSKWNYVQRWYKPMDIYLEVQHPDFFFPGTGYVLSGSLTWNIYTPSFSIQTFRRSACRARSSEFMILNKITTQNIIPKFT